MRQDNGGNFMIFQPNSHDLTLSSWGPYSQKYAGISHVADPDQGVRFDLSVFPGLYRRKVEVPNVMVEGNYHIWEASPDLTYFSTATRLRKKTGSTAMSPTESWTRMPI